MPLCPGSNVSEWCDINFSGRSLHIPLANRRVPGGAPEQWRANLPVVDSDIPAILNILDDGSDPWGLFVRRDDPRTLTEALPRLLDGPELSRDVRRRARGKVKERFCIEAGGRQLKHVLNQG